MYGNLWRASKNIVSKRSERRRKSPVSNVLDYFKLLEVVTIY